MEMDLIYYLCNRLGQEEINLRFANIRTTNDKYICLCNNYDPDFIIINKGIPRLRVKFYIENVKDVRVSTLVELLKKLSSVLEIL